MNFRSKIAALRIFALTEGISYLAFALTMPLKYGLNIPGPNRVVGMLHGALFIIYCVLVFLVNLQVKWDLKTNFWAYIASLIPFGTFVADAKIFKKTQKEMFTKQG